MTTPSNSDVDYGPLATLTGNWKGDKGLDQAPKFYGLADIPYYAIIMFEGIGLDLRKRRRVGGLKIL